MWVVHQFASSVANCFTANKHKHEYSTADKKAGVVMASPGSMAQGWVPQKPNKNADADTQTTFQDYSPSPATNRPQATSKGQPCWGPAPRRIPVPALEGSLGPADRGLPGPARPGTARQGVRWSSPARSSPWPEESRALRGLGL